MGERVARADEPEIERSRVADTGDVERVAVREQRDGEDRLQARAAEVQRLARSGDVRDPEAEGRGRVTAEAREQREDVRTVDEDGLRAERAARECRELALGGGCRELDRVQARARVSDVRAEVGDDHPDRRARAVVIGVAEVHGNPRRQRPPRQARVLGEIATERRPAEI